VPSSERRIRDGEPRWYARFRDPAGAQKGAPRHYFGASLISHVPAVAVSRCLGHSSPEIRYRVHLKPDDEQAGRAVIAETMRRVLPHQYPMRAEKGAE
jgi:hypothetical protein